MDALQAPPRLSLLVQVPGSGGALVLEDLRTGCCQQFAHGAELLATLAVLLDAEGGRDAGPARAQAGSLNTLNGTPLRNRLRTP